MSCKSCNKRRRNLTKTIHRTQKMLQPLVNDLLRVFWLRALVGDKLYLCDRLFGTKFLFNVRFLLSCLLCDTQHWFHLAFRSLCMPVSGFNKKTLKMRENAVNALRKPSESLKNCCDPDWALLEKKDGARLLHRAVDKYIFIYKVWHQQNHQFAEQAVQVLAKRND